MKIFGSKKVSPLETIKSICDCLTALIELKEKETDKEKNKKIEKVSEELSKSLGSLKQIMVKTNDYEPNSEQIAQICHEVYKSQIIPLLIKCLPLVDFENRKDSVQIFSSLLNRKVGVRTPTVDFLLAVPEITVLKLIEMYYIQESSLNVGMMLRDCIRNEDLCRLILSSPLFYSFFQLVENKSFDVASDSFSTFRELLTRHKGVVAEFLTNNYDQFFPLYINLMNSENYVTTRQSIKLLGDILLDRSNNATMIKFVSSSENLKMVMNLLRHKSQNIQFETFHIFKVFVANPDKPKNIVEILAKNKTRIIEFFANFLPSKDKDDEQFYDEKCYVIKTISEL